MILDQDQDQDQDPVDFDLLILDQDQDQDQDSFEIQDASKFLSHLYTHRIGMGTLHGSVFSLILVNLGILNIHIHILVLL